MGGFIAGLTNALGDPTLANRAEEQWRNRQALTQQIGLGDIQQIRQAIAGIQANPYLSEKEKSGRIQAAQSQQLQTMIPLVGRQAVQRILSAHPDLAPFKAQTGTVPAEAGTSISAGGNDLQQLAAMAPQVSPQEMQRLGVSPQQAERPEGTDFSQIPNVQPAPVQEPAKGPTQVSLTPPTTADVLASGAPSYIPYTDPYGNRFMIPSTGGTPIIRQALANAGHMATTQATLNSRESEGQANRESRESEGEANRASREKIAGIHKEGTFAGFVTRAAQAAGIEPSEVSPESLLALRRAWQTAGVTDHVSQGHYFYKNDVTGDVVDVPITRRTSGAQAPMPQISPMQPVAPGAVPSATPNAAPAATPRTTPRQARQNVAAMTNPQGPAPAGGGPGRVIGHVASIGDKAALKGAEKATDTIRPMVNIDQTMGQYIQQVAQNPQAATPRQDLSLIVSAVRAMNPGTVRLPQTELALEIKAGSWGDRFRRQYEIATNGTLPPDQREDLYRIVHHETSVSAANAARELGSSKGQIPPWMQPYIAENANADEPVAFRVDDGPTVYHGTRSQIDKITADGHKVIREQ